MKLLIRSTSFLMNDISYWSNLKKYNLKFAKYNNIFQLDGVKNNPSFDVTILFLQDLIENLNEENNEKRINKLLKLIEKKIVLQKETNHIFFISSYSYLNVINSLKFNDINNINKNYLLKSLYNFSKKYQNIFVVNLDDVFSLNGLKNSFDNRNFSMLRCRLSLEGISILATKIEEVISSFIKPKKKVLLLDCDNTLWGGVVGEEGPEKIQLGQDGIGLAFSNFQKAIKKLKNSGIILSILSKNNEKDIKNIFKTHKGMILKDKDITSYKVNWNEKSDNIKNLSKELSLDPNSFVFWDDNPIEREKVKSNFPSIDVIFPDKETANWSKQILEYAGFSKYSITEDDLKKTQQYKSRSIFLDSKYNAKNEVLFLKKLKIKPKLIKIDKSNIDRAAQLSNKTNQFNFNSKRLNLSDFIVTKNQYNYLLRLKDDLGDHGYVGLISFKIAKNLMLVDQLVLSCRILGRYSEYWLLNQIKKIAKSKKVKTLIFEFIKTDKNQVTYKFIKDNDFENLKKKEISNLNLKKIFKKFLNKKNSELLNLKLGCKIKHLEIYE